MDSKYSDIIRQQSCFFKFYLQQSLSLDARKVLNNIASRTDVYVFSGIIRNFFLGNLDYRDLDIVVGDVDEVIGTVVDTNDDLMLRINSFGGIKLTIQNLTIDLWELRNTWGVKEEKLPLSPYSLLKTAFFNFSAIVFDYNKVQFYFKEDFVNFLKTKMMDVVYQKNPNIPLCIINAYYYKKKYGFGLSVRLCSWVFHNYIALLSQEKSKKVFENEQMRHFSKILVEHSEIKEFVLSCYRHVIIRQPIYPIYV